MQLFTDAVDVLNGRAEYRNAPKGRAQRQVAFAAFERIILSDVFVYGQPGPFDIEIK